MAQLYAKKTSDGLPKALECTDDGQLKVDTEISAVLDPTGLATEATLADLLAKIIAAPSTEAKQDLILTALGLIATEATAGDIKTAAEAIAVATPDTAAGDFASMSADLALMKADLAAILAILES